jgi:hypothetical protein
VPNEPSAPVSTPGTAAAGGQAATPAAGITPPTTPAAPVPAAEAAPAPKVPATQRVGLRVKGSDGRWIGSIPVAVPSAPKPPGSASTAPVASPPAPVVSPPSPATSAAAPAPSTSPPAEPGAKPSTPGSASAAEPEAPAVPDKRLARGWADVIEKEAALTERGKKVSHLEKIYDMAQKGDHLGAIEMLGVDPDKLQQAWLDRIRPVDPAEAGRAAAQKVLDDAKKAEQEAADAKAKAEQERVQAEGQARWDSAMKGIEDASKMIPEDVKLIARFRVNAIQVAQWAMDNGHGFPDTPEKATAVLKAMESFFREETMATGLFTKPAPAPAAAPVPTETAPQARTRDSAPGTITSADAGAVPLRPVAPARRETAPERLKRILAERGHATS